MAMKKKRRYPREPATQEWMADDRHINKATYLQAFNQTVLHKLEKLGFCKNPERVVSVPGIRLTEYQVFGAMKRTCAIWMPEDGQAWPLCLTQESMQDDGDRCWLNAILVGRCDERGLGLLLTSEPIMENRIWAVLPMRFLEV